MSDEQKRAEQQTRASRPVTVHCIELCDLCVCRVWMVCRVGWMP